MHFGLYSSSGLFIKMGASFNNDYFSVVDLFEVKRLEQFKESVHAKVETVPKGVIIDKIFEHG